MNPKFVTKIIMPYYFERVQQLRFCVFDIDNSNTKDLSKQDFIGQAFCTLGDIVTMQNSTIQLTLRVPNSKENRGTLFVCAEEVRALKYSVTFQFRGENLDKKDFFGKSDPYIVISRSRDDGTFTPVLRTPHILKTLNPTWQPITKSAQAICNGDMFRLLRVECFDWNKHSKHSLIGYFDTTLDELVKSEGKYFDLQHPKKKKKKSAGRIYIQQCRLMEEYTFLDYISGGCEMKLLVAIDFTASNGEHTTPGSLHYIGNPNVPNSYVRAIKLVGDILCTYDSTKKIPVFGFGAKLPNGKVSHCFYLNGSPNNPEVDGVDGILKAYYHTLQTVKLFGPTNFAEIINLSTEIALTRSGGGEFQSYCILLILTDGIISDMKQTIDSIVRASDTPLSIIIVGIGNADFSNMDILDADDNPLVSPKYGRMKRDIVQFVPFEQFKHDPTLLAKEVLEELPGQVVEYFKSKNIKPNPPGHGIHQTYVQQDIVINDPIPPTPSHLGFGQIPQNQGFGQVQQGFGQVQQGFGQIHQGIVGITPQTQYQNYQNIQNQGNPPQFF